METELVEVMPTKTNQNDSNSNDNRQSIQNINGINDDDVDNQMLNYDDESVKKQRKQEQQQLSDNNDKIVVNANDIRNMVEDDYDVDSIDGDVFDFSSSDLSETEPDSARKSSDSDNSNTVDIDKANNNSKLIDKHGEFDNVDSSGPRSTSTSAQSNVNIIDSMDDEDDEQVTNNKTEIVNDREETGKLSNDDAHSAETLTMDNSITLPCTPHSPSECNATNNNNNNGHICNDSNDTSKDDSLASEDGNAIFHFLGMSNEIVGYFCFTNKEEILKKNKTYCPIKLKRKKLFVHVVNSFVTYIYIIQLFVLRKKYSWWMG